MRQFFLLLIAAALAACASHPATTPQTRRGLTPTQLNNEFQPCSVQGQQPGCITPSRVQDVINTFAGRTPVSVTDYGASTGLSDNSTPFNQAFANGGPVFIPPGIWNVCAPTGRPTGAPPLHIIGYDGNPNPGSNGPSQSDSITIVTCPNAGSFSNGQAFFNLKDHDIIEGVSVYGLNQLSSPPQVNCVNALNAVSVTIKNNAFIDCYEGVSRFSNGSAPGASCACSQLATIEGNLFYRNTDHGYYAALSNGGFVSDELIGPNNDFVVNGNSSIYMNGGPFTNSQIVGNRIEDGNNLFGFEGIDLESTAGVIVTGNLFDKIQAVLINGGTDITLSGNRGGCCFSGGTGGGWTVELSGTNQNIQSSGNDWEGFFAVYKVDSAATVTGFIAESAAENSNGPTGGGGALSALYWDSNTQTVLAPITVGAALGNQTATTGSHTQTFTNSPCTSSNTTEAWLPVTGTGLTGTYYVPVCK